MAMVGEALAPHAPRGDTTDRIGGPSALGRRDAAAAIGLLRWDHAFRTVALAGFLISALRALAYLSAIPDRAQSFGADFRLYADAANSWLTTGQFYPAYELAGRYEVIGAGEVLYPPIMLWLFVPFTLLPGFLWWFVPLGLTVWAIYRMRPAWWGLALIAGLSVTHAVQGPFFWGTPAIWLLPAVAWGLSMGWPAVVVLVKPTLAPFILTGIGHPKGLVFGMVGFGLLAAPFGTLWVDWLTAIRNSDLDPSYAVTQNVLLVLPVIAWLSSPKFQPAATRVRRAFRAPWS
jgi:hypothetical protein